LFAPSDREGWITWQSVEDPEPTRAIRIRHEVVTA
jgi:hypothetical protein